MRNFRIGLVARLRSSAQDIAWAANTFDHRDAYWSAPDDWSAVDLMTHLRDTEHGIYLPRLQAAALEDTTVFGAFDAPAWRAENRSGNQHFAELIADYLAGRQLLTSLLDRLDADDWDRQVLTARLGANTVEETAERCYSHTLDHLRQLLAWRQTMLRATFVE